MEWAHDGPDASMAMLDNVVGRHAPCPPVVQHDGVEAFVRQAVVDRDEQHAAEVRVERRIIGPSADRAEDRTGGTMGPHQA